MYWHTKTLQGVVSFINVKQEAGSTVREVTLLRTKSTAFISEESKGF
jgi:hypothetical protein